MNFTSDDCWHALDKEVVFQKLNSSESGLESKEVENRLELFGLNRLEIKSFETIPRILFRQLHNPIVYVLIFSTLFAFLIGKVMDSLVVFSVVILNTLIGFIQEYRAHRIIRALTAMIPEKTAVIREDTLKQVHSDRIVPGDIVVLGAGDLISADLRLFSTRELRCDESILTGESAPVNKNEASIAAETLITERTCMAFNGTYVTSGTGLGIVVATGLKTEFGKISELIEHVPLLQTPMSIATKKIAQWITVGVAFISIGLFFIGYFRGNLLFDAGLAAITLAVAAIPEGLPAIITIASSIGVARMARRRAIIRQLPAVEALGSVSVICTDKTGTLTRNEMTVQRVWTPSGFSSVSGVGYSIEGHFYSNNPIGHQEIAELLRGAILCSDALLEEGLLTPVGDPTEVALVVAGRKAGFFEQKLREEWERIDEIPFESERRMMVSLNDSSEGQWIFIKGAPEEISAVCGGSQEEVLDHVHSMAKDGMRVLAIGKKKVSQTVPKIDPKELQSGFTLLGLVGMIDPPREEVFSALKFCREAGISVKMVTGDHPTTAEAIGRELGILTHGKVVTGLQMSKFSDEEWKRSAREGEVFARVPPEHKLKLVEVLQEAGHVVVMTGDGVNDAPALKRADIGVAMGIKGTAVAKEASDMILADDNFASIQAAVEEGRRVYDNLIKSLAFVLPTSLGQASVIFLAVLFFPIQEGILLHPMSPIQVLWINLVVAVSLSLPLAFEKAESDIMKHPPRKKNVPILTKFLIVKTFTVSTIMAIGTVLLFLWEYRTEIEKGMARDLALLEAQTMAVTAMIFFQIFYLFHCRSLTGSVKFFSNLYIFLGVVLVLVAQIAFVYLPVMNRLFKSTGLNLEAWGLSILIASLIIPIIALEKAIRIRN